MTWPAQGAEGRGARSLDRKVALVTGPASGIGRKGKQARPSPCGGGGQHSFPYEQASRLLASPMCGARIKRQREIQSGGPILRANHRSESLSS
jgi:hypothetical protein